MKTILAIAGILLASFFFANCSKNEPAPTPESEASAKPPLKMSHEEHVKRGEYLVTVMGCNDCHSPKIMTDRGPEPDPKRLLSGHPSDEPLPKVTDKNMVAPGQWALFNGGLTAAVGPWGTSFAANLTPDETGLGNWTIDNFEKALREGKLKGMDNGRTLLPPMPWPNYSHLSNDDLAAIWAYLQSIPPVKNVVPAPIPPVG
ncbi:MAG: c-type cytochrome [Saprospiraceae bacterium]